MTVDVSRLADAVRSRDGQVKVIPYLMAGYPDRDRSVEMGRAWASAGAAAIEVGIPFSDPLADGPTIQRAGQTALAGGMTVAGALEVGGAIAAAGVPVVVMTYVNSVLAFGPARFGAEAAKAGIAGVIVPDLPAQEAEPVAGQLRAAGLDTVFLVAPTSPDERIEGAARASSGFVYCVTLTGVTGARGELASGLEPMLRRVRAHTDLPIAAGFGISRPEHVRSLAGLADAAVVGSALMEAVHQGADTTALLKELVSACQ